MKKTFLILAALLCGCFALKAQDFTYNNLNYRVTGTNPRTVTLRGYTEGFAAHDFVTPSTVTYGGTTYSVTSIGEWAFAHCSGFTGSLTIGSSVTSIGNCAFEDCSGFTGSLTIGSSVTSIGDDAFEGCSGFNGSLTIGSSVTSIGNSAFEGCSGFTGNLIIPNSLESIGNSAFEGCSGFNGELILGMSVVSIGDYAFKNNQFSQIVAKPGIIPATGTDAFYGISELQSVFVPCGSESDYEESWSGLADKIKENFVMNDLIVASSNPDYGSVSIIKYSDCESGLSIVTATPAANCMFRNWTENGVEVSTTTPYTFTLERDCNLVANFTEYTYVYGPIMSLPSPIDPDAVYHLGYQVGNDYYLHTSGTEAGQMHLSKNPENPIEYKINSMQYGTGTIIFAFANNYGSSGNNYLHIDTQGVSYGTFNPMNSPTDPFSLSIVNGDISSVAASGYTVCHNENDIITVHTGTSGGNLRFFSNRIIKPLYHIAVSATPEGAGMATATTGGVPVQSAAEGTEITVTAEPVDGYKFVNWTENGVEVSTTTPYTFTLTNDRNLVANFTTTDQYDFTAICPTGQKLYYRIIDAEQNFVSIVAPNSDNYLDSYNGYTRPIGNISLPETVSNNEISYTVKKIGAGAFYQCNGLTGTLTIPNSVTSIGVSAFEDCSGFTGSLTIPNNVISIGRGAFAGCSGFTGSLTIGSSVESIGDGAFYECSRFTGSLTIPNSVTSIGASAFDYCSGFTGSLTIPNSVTSIGEYAFGFCSGFTGSLTIPNSVTSIGFNAFCECSGFTGSLTIGGSVTSIGEDAFADCSGFTNIIAKRATPPTLGDDAFDGMTNLETITVPCGKDGVYKTTTGWSNFASIIEDGIVHDLTLASANPAFGSASITQQATCENPQVTVTATPNDGYRFVNWTENDEEVSTDNTYTFTLESDRSLVANFAVMQTYHITVSATPEGAGTATATMGGEPVESALEGSEITVSATHAEGYVFLNWTENGRQVSTSSTYTFTLESDRNLVANFTQYTYAPITSLPGPTTDPVYVIGYQDGDDFYLIDWGGDYESPMHLSKNPDNPLYYHFDFESGETYKDFTCAKVGHYYYLKIEEGHAFVSTFFGGDDEQPYMIELSPNGDIFSYGSDNNALYHDGDIVKTHKYYLADNLRFFRLLRYFPVIVSASPAEGGTVSATCDGHEVTQALEGSTVTVTATPAEGYMFKNWTEYGRVVSTDNPYSFGIGGYSNLVANFVEPQYDFSAICETGQTLYYRITDGAQHLVSIVAPLGDDPSGWGSSKPEGNIVLPQTVIHDGIEYVVTEIGDYAFHNCRDLRGLLNIPVTVTRIGDFAFYKESGTDATLSIPDHVTSIGTSAFKSRFIESIYIGNSVESIGSEALYVYANTHRHVVSKAQTPPDFEGGFVCLYDLPQRIYIHIPKNTLAAYQSAWGDQYNYIEMNDCVFRPGMYDMWSFWENWSNRQHIPELYDNVTILGKCLLDVDATVSELRVAAGKTLTIGEGKTLTAVSIILENGAQLINNGTVNCDNVTVEKAIGGYGEDMGDWHLVSSPVTTSARTSGMASAPTADYDLYRFSQAGDSQGREWLNYKAAAFGIENQSGYLYASKDYTTIVFRGKFAATDAMPLAYDANAKFAGFNLIGNPYPCNATISGTNLRSSNYFYKMNAGGTALEVVANPIIAPCTGVFAVAANSDATVTFAQASATANVTRGEKSSLQDIRVELLANGKVIDRAFLNMNSESLPKFRLQDNTSEICFYLNKEELAVASTDATRGEMPLNFKAAKTGTYTLTANAGNANLNYLHLVDNMTGDDIDLLTTPSHTFNASVCDDAARFKLVFGMKNAESDFAYISNGEIVVSSEGRATLMVIDMLGRIVSSHEINGEGRVSTQGMAAGVYVLNLNGMTQKIVVR